MELPLQRVLILLTFTSLANAQQFWTPERKTETAIYAAAIAADSWSSEHTNAPELNPLAGPFVNHGAGMQALGSSLGFLAGIGPSYLLHRSGHEKASRWWLRALTAGETINAAQMLYRYH